jgi:hypothetical protein
MKLIAKKSGLRMAPTLAPGGASCQSCRNLAQRRSFFGKALRNDRDLYMGNFLRWAFFGISVLALGACSHSAPTGNGQGATTPNTNALYEGVLNLWLNRTEEDLIAAWGVPERSQRLTDGGQVLEYRHVDSSGRTLCTTLFTSDVYGMIRTWTYRGSECSVPKLGDYGPAA